MARICKTGTFVEADLITQHHPVNISKNYPTDPNVMLADSANTITVDQYPQSPKELAVLSAYLWAWAALPGTLAVYSH